MDLLDLPQLANRSGLPLSLARYYRDRFILFVPSIRFGRRLFHPLEAVDVLVAIRDHAASGLSADAIQSALEEIYPVTVVNAQELSGPAESAPGAFGAVRALAAAIDERSVRVELEVAMLREQIAASSQAQVAAIAELARPVEPQPAAPDHSEELRQLRGTIEELRAHISLLASRDQLEWIGDVVAAAALRPPQGAMDAAIERRLLDLQKQIQALHRAHGSEELGELKSAVDRLTLQSGGRDQEIHSAFQMLIGAVRKEIAAVHARLAELKMAINGYEMGRLADEEFQPAQVSGHPTVVIVDTNGTESNGGRHKSRSPRRLGHPLRGVPTPEPLEPHATD
jgi:DNA-binding transcriptional MerR regulator